MTDPEKQALTQEESRPNGRVTDTAAAKICPLPPGTDFDEERDRLLARLDLLQKSCEEAEKKRDELRQLYDESRASGRERYFILRDKKDTRNIRTLALIALFVIGLNIAQWLISFF